MHSKTKTCARTHRWSVSTSHASTTITQTAPPWLASRTDIESGEVSGVVRGTPTLFINGVLHEGSYDPGGLRHSRTMTLPELHLAEWRPTKDTLHLYGQIVGKIRLATTAPRNHWWNAPLYVNVRGLTSDHR